MPIYAYYLSMALTQTDINNNAVFVAQIYVTELSADRDVEVENYVSNRKIRFSCCTHASTVSPRNQNHIQNTDDES